MVLEPSQLRESPSGAPIVLALDGALLWVDATAPAGGNGNVLSPFQTPAEAVAAVPAGEAATVLLAPGDYSATPAVSIADRNITFQCLGGPMTGAPTARALMPNVTFAASVASLVFAASNCVFPLLTVLTAVEASLSECSSTWLDAGALSVVRSTATPLGFAVAPTQTFDGSVGSCVLWGCLVTSLVAVNVVSSRGFVAAAPAAGIVCSGALVMYDHEFGAGAVAKGTTGLFIDQWTLYQALELAADLGATPPLSVQELPALDYYWGARNWAPGDWINPYLKFSGNAADSSNEWMGAPRKLFAARITMQVDAALAEDKSLTLYVGATRAAAEGAPTALTVTLPSGSRFAKFALAVPVVIPEGSVLLVRVGAVLPVVANNVECHVTLL